MENELPVHGTQTMNAINRKERVRKPLCSACASSKCLPFLTGHCGSIYDRAISGHGDNPDHRRIRRDALSLFTSLMLVAAILLFQLSGALTGGRLWSLLAAKCSLGRLVVALTLLILDVQLWKALASLRRSMRGTLLPG